MEQPHHNLDNFAVSAFVRELVIKSENLRNIPPSPPPTITSDEEDLDVKNEISETPTKTKLSFSIESIIGIK